MSEQSNSYHPLFSLIKVLLIEDNPGDARLIREMILEARGGKFTLDRVGELKTGLEYLSKEKFDLVLLDLSLPDSSGLETLTKVRAQVPELPIIILTGLDDERVALKAVREGAQDYLIKGEVTSSLLMRAIRYAIERKQKEEKLFYRATHDALTNLPNRAMFNDRLTQTLAQAQRNRHKLAVMLVDLDQFKKINDTRGHEVGDKLLLRVGKRLTKVLRRSDTVARMGGDEYLILLPKINREGDGEIVAQKILKVIREPFIINHQELRITVSMGISIWQNDNQDGDTLIKQADMAMYQVKEKGGNNYQCYI